MAQNLQIPVEINISTNEQSVSSLQNRINQVARTARNRLNTALSSEQAANNLRRVNNLLGNQIEQLGSLKGKLGTVLNIAQRVMQAFEKIGTVSINVAISGMKKFVNVTQGAVSAIKGMYDKVTGIFNIFDNALVKGIGLAALVKLSKEALEVSSNLVEVQNVVDTTFEKASNKVNKFAEDAIKGYGLTELQAKRYASTIGAIAKASGQSADATLTMSLNLTKLSADVASFFNYDYDTAFGKIRSGLTGETEPLKDLGVNMSVANLEAYRLSQGITTSYNSMSAAEQMALRYNFIMSSLADTQNDFNKTQGTWANQVRILQGQLTSLAQVLGNLLQKILYPVLIVVNQIVAKAIAMGNILAKAFGFDAKGLEEQQSGTDATVATPVVATATDKEAKAQDNLANSTKKATAAKKKQNAENNKQLASIHKLNVLQKKSSSTSATAAKKAATKTGSTSLPTAATGLSFELAKYKNQNKKEEEETVSDFEKFIQKIKELAKQGDFEGIGKLLADQVNDWVDKLDFKDLTEKAVNFATNFGKGLTGFIKELDTANIGKKLGEFINLIIKSVNALYENIDFGALGAKLAEGINGLLDTIDFEAVGQFLVNKFNAVFETLAGLFMKLDWVKLGQGFTEVVNSIFDNADWDALSVTLITGINGLITAAGEFIFGFDWAKNGAKIGKLIGETIRGIDWQGLGIDLSEAVVGVLDFITNALENMDIEKTFESIRTGIKSFFANLFEELKNKDLVNRLTTLINTAVKELNKLIETIPWDDIYQTIRDFIGNLDWGAILELIANIWGMKHGVTIEAGKKIITEVFQAMIKKAGEWVGKLIDKLLEPFRKLKETIAGFFGGDSGGAGTSFGNSGGAGASFASASNRPIAYTIPEGFAIDSLPHLAKGAVIPPNNQFLAVLGDQRQGTNIETPLNTMMQAFKSALLESNYSGTGDIYIPVYVNNELTEEEIIRKQEIARYRSNGKH